MSFSSFLCFYNQKSFSKERINKFDAVFDPCSDLNTTRKRNNDLFAFFEIYMT